MTNPPILPAGGKPGDFIVARPRATDAVGLVLRGAFDGVSSLPDDMLAALAKIDRATSH